MAQTTTLTPTCAETLKTLFVLKNTFIDVYIPPTGDSARRSSSLPAWFRAPVPEVHGAKESAFLSDTGAATIDSNSTQASCGEDSAVSDMDEMFALPEPEDSAEATGVSPEDLTDEEDMSISPVKPRHRAKHGKDLQTSFAGKTPLNPRAPSWRPGGKPAAQVGWPQGEDIAARGPQPQAPWHGAATADAEWTQSLKQEASHMLASVASAVGGQWHVVRSEVRRAGGGLRITAFMNAHEGIVHTERVLTAAKEALLASAEASSCLYVMGYLASPFASTPRGFQAMLGNMEDESQACWCIYNKGFCPRGCGCTWRHPSFLMPVAVDICFEVSKESCVPSASLTGLG